MKHYGRSYLFRENWSRVVEVHSQDWGLSEVCMYVWSCLVVFTCVSKRTCDSSVGEEI